MEQLDALGSSWPLLMLLAIAAAVDLRTSRIPNGLSLAVLALGVFERGLAGAAWESGAASFALIFLLTFLFYLSGQFGAGDVKLMAATAVFFDPSAALLMLLASIVAGALLGLAVVLLRGEILLLLRRCIWRLRALMPCFRPSDAALPDLPSAHLPFAPAIFLGSVYVLATHRLELPVLAF